LQTESAIAEKKSLKLNVGNQELDFELTNKFDLSLGKDMHQGFPHDP